MKKISLTILIFSVFLVLASCKPAAETRSLTVFSDGESNYSLVTAAGASQEALDLAKEIKSLSDSSLEVISDTSSETALEILVGDTNRGVTADIVNKLKSAATASAFHYIIAEKDGKIVIVSDADVGYIYALDYIKSTYISDGKFIIPQGICDLKQVMWHDYYASDLYFDRLTAEADKNRFEEGKDQLEDEKNRYEDSEGNTVLTVKETIEKYTNMIASFNTPDFGEYTSATFINGNSYRKPTFYPDEAHPRILFTESSIDSIRTNLSAEQNELAYEKYIALSDSPCDGKFKTLSGSMSHNYDEDIVSKIEAKAFRYAMTGEKLYGYEAIYAIKNAILTINVPHSVGDWCRTYGHLMYVAACVYDWCYDLLEPIDKDQIIAGGVNLLGAHLEVVCYVGSGNLLPTGQGTIYGHGAEHQLLCNYLAFAIATFGDASEIYELVAGRILNDYVEAQNYLFQSGSHWEGSYYGPYRTTATLMANILLNKMTDGEKTPFENVDKAVNTMTYYYRPDGQIFRSGDVNEQNGAKYDFSYDATVMFLASNLYTNNLDNSSYLKSYAYKYSSKFKNFHSGDAGISNVQFLAINNPAVNYIYEGTAPLTNTTTYPHTDLFAKSANNDPNAFAVFMTMPENYAASHAHMECGSFQIYYKGILASQSGAYDFPWGSTHHMGYSMQTIASNSLLIYNPKHANDINSSRPTMIYSGGQSIDNGANLPSTLDDLLNRHPALGQCTSLGTANVEKGGVYLYSYMGGDMTKAYDSDTVDEVTRYMVAVATGDESYPLVFLTFDRITSDDASYKKTALIHVQEAPTLENGFAIITNTKGDNNGKMIVQSVGFGTEYTLVGGEGNEFVVNGTNLPQYRPNKGDNAEYGWGRIEISPTEAKKTNHMLTVMYVTDATNNAAPIAATEILSENLAGASIHGKNVLFSKNEKLLTEASSFTLNTAGECFIAGVSAGTWTITGGGTTQTVIVEDGTNLINFNASATGNYTITKN